LETQQTKPQILLVLQQQNTQDCLIVCQSAVIHSKCLKTVHSNDTDTESSYNTTVLIYHATGFYHGRTGVRLLFNEISQILTPHSLVTAQPTLMKHETYSYCRKTTHHVKQYFDRMTWVVWANRFLSLSFLVSLSLTEVALVD